MLNELATIFDLVFKCQRTSGVHPQVFNDLDFLIV